MHSLLFDSIANFAGSVADSFLEFLLPASLRYLPEIFPTEEPQESTAASTIPSRTTEASGVETSLVKVIGALRNKLESLQQEVYYLRETMTHGMKVLGKPTRKDVERPEFLKELWIATYEKDYLVAQSVVVAAALQEEVQALSDMNFHLRHKLGILKAKVKYLGIEHVGFWDDPGSICRKLLGDVTNQKMLSEALLRENRYLLAQVSRQNMKNFERYASLVNEESESGKR